MGEELKGKHLIVLYHLKEIVLIQSHYRCFIAYKLTL
ncbi:hypothetical protein KM759_gp117 [Lymphocystis disease virus 4]|uniref:Uncharacterized protein n=1 Tax=Lymphocystis disease virus 4 TaxID=2704413 RepID=A0A6B9XMQ7_9VIRU|nr:hypothetical protein KM759_gp117 [Lymphocystis disease virus 4]QHR78581.1 hypothetical protein [Lymphocystis disease virus 4]